MGTAKAAQQAGVTVATIRTWCRIGAVAVEVRFTDTGGRQTIDILARVFQGIRTAATA